MTTTQANRIQLALPKCPTGIQGLDEITHGGLPKGRPTLVCGSAGSGKTLLAMEFLVRGAQQYKESGVFVSFEESEKELMDNVISLGWDLKDLIDQKKLLIDQIYIEPSEIKETGEYDLEGLFVRLGHAIQSLNAKRVALDTLEALFGGFTNELIMRTELRRLFRWLKDKEVTAVITGEPGDGNLTRYGIEEYVSDCVIVVDHRVKEQIGTRRLRVVKYRGSTHGTNEYPFLIGEQGLSVLPITSLGLEYKVTTERVSTGISRLDTMLGGQGYYRGSSILASGTPGTGKSTLATSFVHAACQRGERCLYFALEEAKTQLIRNMRSIGIDLEPWVKSGLLRFHAERATSSGLEMYLITIRTLLDEFKPQIVVFDPMSNLISVGTGEEIKSVLARVIDYLKIKGITALFTNLTHAGGPLETTETAVSSLMDTWILLRDIESGGERNRGIYILKSRGMAHSNQIREFLLTDKGVDLLDVYLGPREVLTGTARATRVAEEKADRLRRQQEIERRQHELERKRAAMEAQVAALRAEFEAEEEEVEKILAEAKMREEVLEENQKRMGDMRKTDE
ncbi:MAG: circadian clock protein KaiC [Deltaproteobacteria bacterium]|nr:MAG: circadian clock protein KaiC [Deltaproteobacteria bacterium]